MNLALTFLSGADASPGGDENCIAPRMLKALVGTGHALSL